MLPVFASKPQGLAYDRVYAYAPLRVATLGIAKGSSHAEVYDASTWVNKTSTKTKVWISTVAGLRLSCFRFSHLFLPNLLDALIGDLIVSSNITIYSTRPRTECVDMNTCDIVIHLSL